MRHSRRQRGTTIIEVVIASVLGSLLVGAAVVLMDSAGKLADSTQRQTAASTKVDRAMWSILEDVRRATLASAEKADGTGFFDGETDSALRMAPVVGFDGDVVRGESFTYRLVILSGQTTGNLLREQGGATRVIARGISDFSVARDRDVFTISLSSRSGPDDDRGRTGLAEASVTTRNP